MRQRRAQDRHVGDREQARRRLANLFDSNKVAHSGARIAGHQKRAGSLLRCSESTTQMCARRTVSLPVCAAAPDLELPKEMLPTFVHPIVHSHVFDRLPVRNLDRNPRRSFGFGRAHGFGPPVDAVSCVEHASGVYGAHLDAFKSDLVKRGKRHRGAG